MRKIFVGLFFVLFNFTLSFQFSVIGLIPTFVGYILFAGGLAELQPFSRWFQKMRPWAIGMAIYTGILYMLDLLGFPGILGDTWVLSWLLGVIATVVQLYILNCIINGVRDAEFVMSRDLNSRNLKNAWTIWCIITLILNTFVWFLTGLGLIAIIVSWAAAIYLLVAFSQTNRLFYSGPMPTGPQPPYSPDNGSPFQYGENNELKTPSDDF